MTLFSARQHRGIGLLELMLSLLVIAIILFSATRYFTVANENLHVAEAAQQINNIVNASYKWVTAYPNFAGSTESGPISMQQLINDGLVTPDYASNPWKGAAIIMPAADIQKLKLTLTAIPISSCNNLVTKMKSYAPDAGCIINMQSGKADFSGTF